jgi:hypothetical protein
VGDKITGRFWWGPITTEANAKNIINVVGWLFVGIGLLGFLPGGPYGIRAGIATFVITAGPGGFLLSRKNRISAGVLLALVASLSAISIVIGVYSFLRGDTFAASMLPLLLIWGLLTWICWRAFRATRFLRGLKDGQHNPMADVFS